MVKRSLKRLKNGINVMINNGLLTNNNILNNKYKLDCAISLIINPYGIYHKQTEFYCNMLICNTLDKNKLNEIGKNNSLINIDEDDKKL